MKLEIGILNNSKMLGEEIDNHKMYFHTIEAT